MAHETDLSGLLADAGIKTKSLRPGHSEKLVCPRCAGGRTRESSLSVTIDDDGKGAVWKCHRGKCGWQSSGRTDASSEAMTSERPVRRPAEHVSKAKPAWLYAWFERRRIGARAVDDLGIYGIPARRFAKAGECEAIVFPYVWRGELVNRKYRAAGDVKDMGQEPDALPTLFNVDRLGDAPEEIIWVEGEPDVAALFEVGIRHVVTLKDGAPAQASFKPDDKRFEALRTHAEVLSKAKRIILAGDMDAPGLALREELARRLGRHRCRTVDWPHGCKDAGETLVEHGPDALLAALSASEAYPIEGLRSAYSGRLQALRELPPPVTLSTGSAATDDILKLPGEGRLIVVTGYPGSGKTAWTRFVMVHAAGKHNRRWAVFSPEMQPWEEFIACCAEVVSGKPFWPNQYRERMTQAEVASAEKWLTDRVVMILSDSEDEAPTLDWLLDHARMAVLRDGVTDLLIDPWNEVDHQRGDMSETDYIGRSLQRLKAFAGRYGCNVWIIAHPAKPPPLRPGEKRTAPGPYDISSSAHWFNKADIGITVHSPAPATAEVSLWKSRFRRWGRRGEVAKLEYDELSGRYTTARGFVPKDAMAEIPQADDEWSGQ